MLGDGGGSHIVIRDNTFLSPGQVGIGVSGGTDIHVLDNVIYGAQRASSNVGLYVWNQTSGTCSGIEVAGNRVRWYTAAGAENPYWDGSNCGAVAGVSTNDWHAALDPTDPPRDPLAHRAKGTGAVTPPWGATAPAPLYHAPRAAPAGRCGPTLGG